MKKIKFDHSKNLPESIGVSKKREQEIAEIASKLGFQMVTGSMNTSMFLEELIKAIDPKTEAEFFLLSCSHALAVFAAGSTIDFQESLENHTKN